MNQAMVVALAFIFIATSSTVNGGRAPGPGSTVPGEILVRFRSENSAEATVQALGLSAEFNSGLGVWRIDAGSVEAAAQLLERLKRDPTVTLAQPQYLYESQSGPSDPLYAERQHVHFRTINLPAAWEAGTPPQQVLVAVLDGGVDVAHPDLASRVWRSPGETANGIDDDGNGCVDDIRGCNVLVTPPDGDIDDRDGHGTFAAGLIAAEADNHVGVAGIAANATILPVRMLNEDGKGDTEQLAAAIRYAVRAGAQVLNLSLALPPEALHCPRDELVEEALLEATEQYGATIVAAAGNAGFDCVSYPAASDHAIAVAASGPAGDSDSHARFSQWGPEIDVAAPGVGIVSTCPLNPAAAGYYCSASEAGTTPQNPYGSGDGTSFAAPIVSGVAALLLGRDPHLTGPEVERRLRDTARDVPDEIFPNWDGAGIVDAGAALGTASIFSSLDLFGDDLSQLTLTITAESCEARVWHAFPLERRTLTSTVGGGDCASAWPPSVSAPWQLEVSTGSRKSVTVNSWGLRGEGISCGFPGTPVTVPPGQSTRLTIDCRSDSWVSNDSPAGAMELDPTLPRTVRQDIRYASAAGGPAAGCVTVERSVWFRLPPGEARTLGIDTFGTSYDTGLAVFRATASGLAEVACNDNWSSPQSRVVLQTDGVSAYLIAAGAVKATAETTLRLNVVEALSPANDSMAGAVVLPTGVPHTQPALNATSDPSDPVVTCSDRAGRSLWFAVEAGSAGEISVTTAGSTYDTAVSVYEMAGTVLAEVACNDQAPGGGNTSLVSWRAEAGRTYFLQVVSFRSLAPGVLRILRLP